MMLLFVARYALGIVCDGRPFPRLCLYRFYRDCVEEQLSIPLYGYRVGLSVVDNSLIVHYRDSKMAMVRQQV